MERKYSVSEIDRMRNAIKQSYPSGVPYYPKERTPEIEGRLRTFMLNGTDPEELEIMANDRRMAEMEAYHRRRTVSAQKQSTASDSKVNETGADAG